MKKFVSVMLAGAMVLGAVTNAYSAEDWLDYGSGDTTIRYSTYTGTVKMVNIGSGSQDHPLPAKKLDTFSVEIPAKINGTNIVAIEKGGFYDLDRLAGIKLPDSLVTIGEQAFEGADTITSIAIPNKVKAIPKACFKSCDSLASVAMGVSVESVGEQAFYTCKALKTIALGNNCKSIGSRAFELCTGMESIQLSNSIESIGGDAFKDCKSLKEIYLPASLKAVEANTFSGCTSLKKVYINGGSSIGKNAFKGCTSLTDIYISDSVKKIEDNAFADAKRVTIHCSRGSYAETYAIGKKIAVINDEAASSVPQVVPDKISVYLDGKQLDFNGVDPQIINGCTMVPMRVIFEELGCIMNWDGATKTVSASQGVKSVKLTVGKKKASLNNKEVILDAAPTVVNGTTLVPVRFVSEAMGVQVRWDGNTRTVNLISK